MKPAPAAETLVEGEVERVTFENEQTGFRVVKLAVAGRSDRLTVVGSFPRVGVGTRVRVRGSIETSAKHGEQLRAASVTELQPDTLLGVAWRSWRGELAKVTDDLSAALNRTPIPSR